jgi:hypothetical protein
MGGNRYRMGTEVPVIIDPQQPQRAVINTFIQKGTIFMLIGALTMGFALVVATNAYTMVNG